MRDDDGTEPVGNALKGSVGKLFPAVGVEEVAALLGDEDDGAERDEDGEEGKATKDWDWDGGGDGG